MGSRRLTRSDKKKDVKPTISENLKTTLYKFCELSNKHVKDVAEELCVIGCKSEFVISEMRNLFRRDYKWNETVTFGNPNIPRIKVTTSPDKGKVTIKFKQKDYDQIADFAYCLGITPTTACAVLIMNTLSNRRFMQWYLANYYSRLNHDTMRNIYRLLRM